MADVQSNIKVSIDTTDALASIKNLQRQISAFHTSMAKGGAAANAVTAQMQQGLINSINATGKFSAQMKTIRTTTESFTDSLQKNKFSLGEYFRYAGGASKSFGKLFKTEFDTINKVARENVKDLQTQYIKMGRDANGAMKAIAVRPLSLDMNDLATKTMIASEKQALLNQLLKQGSTNLLNFGKNTQWAGRQLMVGFTIPLMAVGSAAAKTFMDMETQAIRFKKVYGDLFTPASETKAALDGITELGKQFTKYGVAVSQTVGLAAEAAAAGFQGLDLQRQTAAATKLSILGQVDSQKALETTISLQNAFSMSSENLAESIDFLNAVENQTVLSLDDMSTAIPKAAPIVQQLGGDVKDLAFLMTAMKEGGINASEGANALKSGLASLINPTGKAAAMLEGFGINAKKIVVDNKGDLKKTVIEFATALNQLDPLNRAQAIEQLFGKFQFSRLSTLFANVTKEGTQAARVLDLAGSSVQELASLSEKELGMTSESAMNKFKASVENLKLSLVPVGEEFLKAATPIVEFVGKILDKFNNLGDGTKKIIVTLTAVIAGLGPVLLMTFGLLANGIANIIKGFVAMKTIFNKAGQSSATLGTEVKYMTVEQRNAAAVAASLDQVHRTLAQTFTSEAAAVDALVAAYNRAIVAQRSFMPTGVPMGRGPVTKRAEGKPLVVGGTGNKDSELSLLQPGETVIPTKMSKKYGSLINGMIADNIPGYAKGKKQRAAKFFSQEMIDDFYEAAGIEDDTAKVRIPLPITSPSYSVSGVMAPKTVNTKKGGIGMDREYLSSPMGRAALDASIQAEIESLGISASRASEVLDEIAPQLNTAVNKFDDTIEGWQTASTEAIQSIEASPNLTKEEKKAIRRRIAPVDPTDYTVVSDPVLEIKKKGTKGSEGKGTPRNERKDSPYLAERQKEILKSKGYDSEDLVFAHMPGYEKIEGKERATMRPPTSNRKVLTGKALAEAEALREKFLLNQGISKEEISRIAQEDAKVYQDAIDKKSGPENDLYVKNRSKKRSAHQQAIKDGTDDENGYQDARDKAVKKRTTKRRAASRPQGAPTSIVNPGKRVNRRATSAGGTVTPGGMIVMPSAVSAISALEEGPMYGPSRPTTFDRTAGSVAGRFRGIAGKTQARFAGKTAGLGMAGSAAMMAGSFLPGKAGQLAQQAMPVAFGLQALQMALKLPIPHLKAVAGVALLAYGAFKLFNNAREKERLAIEGLGDAATVSKNKLKTLGDFFGIVPTQIDYLSRDAASNTGATPQEQTAIDSLQENKQFQKDFKNDIASLKKGTAEQAKLVFDSIAIQLRGSGFAKEQIDLIIKALQEESGKTDVKFDFANIDLSTDKGILNFDKSFGTILKQIDSGITQSYTRMKYFDQATQKWVGGIITNISEEAKVNLKLASDAATGFINGLSAQLKNGTISADQFNQGFARIHSTIATMPKPEQIIVLDAVFKTLPENLQKATAGMIDTGQRMEILQAQSLGLTGAALALADAFKVLNSPQVYGPEGAMKLNDAQTTINKIKKQVADYAKFLEKTFKTTNGAGTNPYKDPDTGGTGKGKTLEEQYLEILEKQIDALQAKLDAQKKINDEIQREVDLANKLEDLASQAVNAKISGNYIQAAMLGRQSIQAQAEFDAQTALNRQEEPIDLLRARQKEIQGGAKLTTSEKAQVSKKANGGLIKGPGTGRSDSIRATLGYAGGGAIRVSNGEFVVKASSVRDYGINAMNAVNNGTANIDTNSGGTVYNINMPITSNSASPEGVANEVMRRLKVELNKNNKSNRVNI